MSHDDGYLVYEGSHGHRLMAGYTGLPTYGDNNAGGWRLVSLASYDAIMKPATETLDRMLVVLFATLVGCGRRGSLGGAARRRAGIKADQGCKDTRCGSLWRSGCC